MSSFNQAQGTTHPQYIAGHWEGGASERIIINPATGFSIARVAEGDVSDVARASASAAEAFTRGPWAHSTPAERAALLDAIADAIERDAPAFAELETLNCGKPLRESRSDVKRAIRCFRYYASYATAQHTTTMITGPLETVISREPIGVCGLIVPWNFPLLMAAWKLAPALAAGNCCILKPSELTPLSAIRLFAILDTLPFPPGVVQLLLGDGATIGAGLVRDPAVEKIAFTGGTQTGRDIMRAAADQIKRISLELGGKSAIIVCADADLGLALDFALYAIFVNAGQVCTAGSRLVLEASIAVSFTEALVKRAQQIVVGDGTDPATQMGPLISEQHLLTVQRHVETARAEGARLLCGGSRLHEGRGGYFFEPTIFEAIDPTMALIQQEIFGPVLAIEHFTTEDQAVMLANTTIYGLAGAVFSKDLVKAERLIKQVKAGVTWINSYHLTSDQAPWGGYKQSGLGRELGSVGYEEYTEVKQINRPLQPEAVGWF